MECQYAELERLWAVQRLPAPCSSPSPHRLSLGNEARKLYASGKIGQMKSDRPSSSILPVWSLWDSS
ncbi:uncharacterized [Tachysurus ichikawai]